MLHRARHGRTATPQPGLIAGCFSVALVLACVLTFLGSLSRPLDGDARFLSDRNVFVTGANGLPKIWTSDFFAGAATGSGYAYLSGYYRPLTNTVFWLEYRAGGSKAWVYNLTQVLLHCIAALLLFSFGSRLLGRPAAAGLAACVFVLHPMNAFVATEPKALSDVLVFIFYMASLNSYLRALQSERPRLGPIVASAVFFAAALLSKEMAVTLVATAILVNLYLFHAGRSAGYRLAWSIPLWLVLAAYVIVRIGVLHLVPNTDVGYGARHGDLVLMLNMPKNLAIYLCRLLFPLGSGYPDLLPGLVNFVQPVGQDPLMVGSLGLILLLCVLVLLLRRRRPEYAFLIALFLVSSAPLLAVRNIGGTLSPDRILAHSRWAYLPIAAPLLLLSDLVVRAWRRVRPRGGVRVAGYAVAALVLAGLARQAAVHAAEGDTQAALLRQYRRMPADKLGRFERANEMIMTAGELYYQKRKIAPAIELCREAVRLAPDSPIPVLVLARLLLEAGRPNDAGSILNPWLNPSREWVAEQRQTNVRVVDDLNRNAPAIAFYTANALSETGRGRPAATVLCMALRRGFSPVSIRHALDLTYGLNGPSHCLGSRDRRACLASAVPFPVADRPLDSTHCDGWARVFEK